MLDNYFPNRFAAPPATRLTALKRLLAMPDPPELPKRQVRGYTSSSALSPVMPVPTGTRKPQVSTLTKIAMLTLLTLMPTLAAAQAVCDAPEGDQLRRCYSLEDGMLPAVPAVTKDYGQVFAAGDLLTYLSFVSPSAAQSAWVMVWPEGRTLRIVRVKLTPGVRRSVRLDLPVGTLAATVRVLFEADGIVGLAMHPTEAFMRPIVP